MSLADARQATRLDSHTSPITLAIALASLPTVDVAESDVDSAVDGGWSAAARPRCRTSCWPWRMQVHLHGGACTEQSRRAVWVGTDSLCSLSLDRIPG